MHSHILLATAGLLAAVQAVPASSPAWGSYGYGGKAPKGWNAKVENFCGTGFVLECCEQVFAGTVGLPDATATGCRGTQSAPEVCKLMF